MISAFEATILGFVSGKPSSRYDLMKAFQNNSMYWSGSPGAVYGAIARLEEKSMLQEMDVTGTKTFEVTDLGLAALRKFMKVPVPAAKLFLDPALLRIKLRGLDHLSDEECRSFLRDQLHELKEAKQVISERRERIIQSEISQDLADLALVQLTLEEELIQKIQKKYA